MRLSATEQRGISTELFIVSQQGAGNQPACRYNPEIPRLYSGSVRLNDFEIKIMVSLISH